jgi:hypothetical protein
MPIDNITLMRHQPPPEKPKRRPRWVPPLVFLLGAAAMILVFACCRDNPARSKAGATLFVVLLVVYTGFQILRGWNEDGLAGTFYRLRRRLGSMLAGDEERDGLAIVIGALAFLAATFAIVLLARWGAVRKTNKAPRSGALNLQGTNGITARRSAPPPPSPPPSPSSAS